MDKQTSPHDQHHRDRAKRHEDQPVWRKTTPRGNQEVHRADMERSAERLEMLLGH
jgi:hypothetical protein